MGRQIKYEFLRIIDRIEEENILLIIANIREVSRDSKTGQVNVLSRHSHSAEYPLNNIPRHIQILDAMEPTQISPQEFEQLTKIYKNDIDSFLLYKPKF
ncbi:hypothetical protein ACE1MS_23510 (plasmid) [Lysinibacillus sp. fkY74-1]|uniref:hypothetical protein n=1 Tax=Lysinibacillus fusiformis TaxID=28031 RepID=UPI000884AAB1|nr:hypothetical protein [Lysinibacillus fusiformis]WEA41663.1 hypothetical protein PWJ66_23275 [Lysinibacillus fusiformis]SCX63375.1 hypothetical protein SAMN02787108_03241 [Lysinibacillus fusiformis]SDB46171.1 hypothetical protein SAMN02787070_03436 [Lysinibacillus fusiformis]SFI72673.1 hypothetical protein SAMN02787080_03455 [Lysinibacillus fusiformis]SFT15564.1 hypothetical protein SAMN02787099_03156 [Lysinibacillus fusiformis]